MNYYKVNITYLYQNEKNKLYILTTADNKFEAKNKALHYFLRDTGLSNEDIAYCYIRKLDLVDYFSWIIRSKSI